MNASLMREELRFIEYEGVEVHFCEPEQGQVLGKDDVDDEMMMYLVEHKERMPTTSDKEEEEINVFLSNCLSEFEFIGIKHHGAK